MAERHVRLPLVIQTFGEFCHSEDWEQSCPKLFGERHGVWCGIFESHLLSRDDDDPDDGSHLHPEPVPRCAECLALDGGGAGDPNGVGGAESSANLASLLVGVDP